MKLISVKVLLRSLVHLLICRVYIGVDRLIESGMNYGRG